MVWYHLSEKKITELYDITCKVAGSSKKSKPRGLWLSYNNDWEEWNDTGEPGVFIVGNYKYKYKITLKKNINVLKIETVDELHSFNKKYGKKDKYIKSMVKINWEKVCKDYDGIFFMNYRKILDDESIEYNDEFIWYNMLDVSSACIFRPSLVISKLIEESL